ncbi:hypothetical protein ACLOJK_014533 [Asimina triloba]
MFSNPETQIAEYESGVPFEQRVAPWQRAVILSGQQHSLVRPANPFSIPHCPTTSNRAGTTTAAFSMVDNGNKIFGQHGGPEH